jgi:hypothetical protein
VIGTLEPSEPKRLGHVAPLGSSSCTSCEGFGLRTAASSPSYAVPRGRWRIISWSARGATNGDAAARLLVFRRTSTPGRYRLIAESATRQVPADDAPTFASAIRVRRGDRLGLETIGSMP